MAQVQVKALQKAQVLAQAQGFLKLLALVPLFLLAALAQHWALVVGLELLVVELGQQAEVVE